MADLRETLIGEPDLVSKKGVKSAAWTYFGFTPDADKKPVNPDTAVCRFPTCRMKEVMAKGGNTSNLLKHLKVHHPDAFALVKPRGQSKTPDAVHSGDSRPGTSSGLSADFKATQMTLSEFQVYPKGGKKWKTLTEAVTYCIAKDSIPIYSVDKDGFRKMLKAFDSRYDLPGRNYFTNTALPALYTKLRNDINAELLQKDYYSLTMDMWSSRTTDLYLGVTVHFINDTWELQSKCLETIYLPEAHTAENLADYLKLCLEDWDLDISNLACVTTDNGSNIVKMAKDMNLTRLSCFGHNLHLAITNSMKDEDRVARAVTICKGIVGAFSNSHKRRQLLSENQLKNNLPQKMLISECTTRWGSRQAMIDRILEQETAISQTLATDNKLVHLIMRWQDRMVLEAVNNALKPLAQFTDILSGDSYVSASTLSPTMKLFETADFMGHAEADTELTKAIKSKMLTYMSNKYTDPLTKKLINISCFLDPRYKGDYLDEEDLAIVKRDLTEEMIHHQQLKASGAEETGILPPADFPTPEPPQKKMALGNLLAKVKKVGTGSNPAQAPNTPDDIAKEEIRQYLFLPTIEHDENPLLWWKVHQCNLPVLSKMAKKYLAIQATSSASERLFSVAGNVVSSTRSLLKPANVRMLTFLASNLK